jgi:hypothetical protein
MSNLRTAVSVCLACACLVAGLRALGCAADTVDDLREDVLDNPYDVTAIRGQVEPGVSGVGVIGVRNGVSAAIDITDDEGVYTLYDIPAGEYNLIASGPGFFTDTSARNVVAAKGEQTSAPLITMRELTAGATLRGQAVSDTTGGALVGVHVTVECRTGVCSNISATTDADGRFEVGIWPELSARIVFQMAGYEPAFVSVDPVPPGQAHTVPPTPLTEQQP